MKHTISSFFASTLLLLASTLDAQTKCILPAPDGGIENVSNRNLAGHISRIQSDFLEVREYKTRQLVKVRITKSEVAYSAYGGDELVSKLKSGVAVRIWYKNCRVSASGNAVAAYIESR